MYIILIFLAGWLKTIGSQIVYELDHRKPVLYVIPVEQILGKRPLVPVGDTGTIPHHLHNLFPGAPGDRKVLAMDAGCGLSTRGQWRGPVTCNEWEGELGQCLAPYTTLMCWLSQLLL